MKQEAILVFVDDATLCDFYSYLKIFLKLSKRTGVQ